MATTEQIVQALIAEYQKENELDRLEAMLAELKKDLSSRDWLGNFVQETV